MCRDKFGLHMDAHCRHRGSLPFRFATFLGTGAPRERVPGDHAALSEAGVPARQCKMGRCTNVHPPQGAE